MVVLCGSARAQIINFNFTIVGDPDANLGYTPIGGVVTGTIVGLEDNNSMTGPSDILITSAPASLGIVATPASPYSLIDNGWLLQAAPLSYFSVSNGVLTTSESGFVSKNMNTNDLLFFNLSSTYNGLVVANQIAVGNKNGALGVSFVEVPSVPEPSVSILFGCAFVFLALHFRSRKVR